MSDDLVADIASTARTYGGHLRQQLYHRPRWSDCRAVWLFGHLSICSRHGRPSRDRRDGDETVHFSGLWHLDTTYLEEPPLGSLLYAKEIPPVGGDTLFANVAAAYDSLSEGLKYLGESKAINW